MSLTSLRLIILSILIILFSLLSCIGPTPVSARQTALHPLARSVTTQRAINELAAPVELARRVMLEEAGLRQPNEGLSVYVRRIALPLSSESIAAYKRRITHYLYLLTRSAQAVLPVHTVLALRDTSAANRAQWNHLLQVLPILPARIHKTEAAWQRAQKGTQPLEVRVKHTHFDTELEETMQVILAASNGLRDARP